LCSFRSRRASIHGERFFSSAIRAAAVSGFRLFPYAESCLFVRAFLSSALPLHASKIIQRILWVWHLLSDLHSCAFTLRTRQHGEKNNSSNSRRRFASSFTIIR